MTAGLETALAAGRAAMERGAWREAAARFDEALALEERPEILEERAWAAWWLCDEEADLRGARARLPGLPRRRTTRAAPRARRAWMAGDYLDYRGEDAVATAGWSARTGCWTGASPAPSSAGWR